MDFLGRQHELEMLRDGDKKRDGSCLTVIYGRRRIGKTRLVDQAFQGVPLLKFEGLEGQTTAVQQRHFLDRLAELSGKTEYRLVKTSNWNDVLIMLSGFPIPRLEVDERAAGSRDPRFPLCHQICRQPIPCRQVKVLDK